jgi:hypothetical protein
MAQNPVVTITMENGGVISLEKTVKEMVKDGSIAWTLDPWGATFYFNPYAIGSYMEGIFAATICFDEAPELFKESYRHAPAAYCVELMPYQSQRLAFAKGQKATLHVGQSDKGLLVAMNGKALDEPYVKNGCDWNMSRREVPKGKIFVLGDNRSMPMTEHMGGMIDQSRLAGIPIW